MERVRKTFFDPLATSKAQIREILNGLPVGSAHPFSPERIILCKTDRGIDEIDISSYPEDYFYNAVDLGEMGETLLRRMAGFKTELQIFEDFQIMQAPAATFEIPLVFGKITIFAVSERTPTYYDLCLADESCNTSCFNATNTLSGIAHSGDRTNGKDLLQHVNFGKNPTAVKETCVFISGYQSTPITRFLGTHPALLVANHVDKVLHIIPVPLDTATIGDATICCPLVIKRKPESIICSILPKATTDRGKVCSGPTLTSRAFPEAIECADFNILAPQSITPVQHVLAANQNESLSLRTQSKPITKNNAVFATNSISLPSILNFENTQVISFSTGIEFKQQGEKLISEAQPSSVILPCIFGTQLQGPVLLATGIVPINVPFQDADALHEYYEQLKIVTFIVDDRMTDNARNLASSYRINALFILQLNPENEPKTTDDVLALMNSANINAVTALAGPQSLVLIEISDRFYFYRGLANRAFLNTSGLAFGSEVTSVLQSLGMESIIEPRAKRIIDLGDANTIILPNSNQQVNPQDLQRLFEELPVDQIKVLQEDISAAVPQLQVLLNQKDLGTLSKALVATLSTKVNDATAPLRNTYITFLKKEYQIADPESVKKKNAMLGELRKKTKEMQRTLEPVISSLANMMSSQTTSKRTHDLKRLVRQAQIQGNVEAAKAMTFETLGGFLETHAADMGVMVLNIETTPYRELLGSLNNAVIDANSCCELDSRVLHLEGIDAGIILEQSQGHHDGPLRSQNGALHPVLALPYLSQDRGSGSMLAWVCWDEFVDLESPYTVRWVDKCNEAHIAALRIIMRDTLSWAVESREYNFQPNSPEIGHLMSALLMTAMSKLAAMRTTVPTVVEKADNTVTRLMRGLFGNLLTMAGSGLRPQSMVFQLFSHDSNYDLPTTDVEWAWYEKVVALFPYTGWPLEKFYGNLEKFLDKAIIRVVTKNENVAEIKLNRTAEMIKYCKLRNIQLEHSRTIITIFMRMLTTEGADVAAIARRLLERLPHQLERQTQSYTNMVKYLEHLSNGGQRRPNDDLFAASVYTKRSAAFREFKIKVSQACTNGAWDEVTKFCQALMDKHIEIATLWKIKPKSLKIQNMEVYKSLLCADLRDDVDEDTKMKNQALTRQVLCDAEMKRLPWQVGKEGQFNNKLEPLDEALLHEILSGEAAQPVGDMGSDEATPTQEAAPVEVKMEEEFMQFSSLVKANFITTMQKSLSLEDVCRIINIPPTTLRVFINALNPVFELQKLGSNFKVVILGMLKNRSDREGSRPSRKLLDLRSTKQLQIGN